MNVAPIKPPALDSIESIGTATGTGAVEKTPGKVDVGETFQKALADAHHLEHNATDAAERFAKGDPSMGIHEVMIASEKANLAVRYATTLKNKALEAYKELMNTQV